MGKEWNVFYRSCRWVGVRPRRWLPRGRSFFWLLTRDHRIGMHAVYRKGICRVSYYARHWSPGGAASNPLWVGRYPNMKKVKLGDRGAVRHLAALESEVLRDHMPVVEQLALLQYEDGTPRQGGYLGVYVDGSAWVLIVKDRDAGAQLRITGRTFDEALGTLALMLGAEDAPWEVDPNARQKGGRKTK
jgi:hypothetical protein